MYSNQQFKAVLPPVPPLRTPIYSGSLHIGTLDHHSRRITFFHSPFTYRALGTEPGSFIQDHLGRTIGRLGYNGQMHRINR